MKRPNVLVTNDDGIDSFFLRVLVESLMKTGCQTFVAAPDKEQSWIGRAFSRWRTVSVERSTLFDTPAWAIDGTPSDCVNIALGHLLAQPPDLVVSGINIGVNLGNPLVFSSGTLAGAIEAAGSGIPAIAFSQQIDVENHFRELRRNRGHCEGAQAVSLRHAATHAARMALERIEAASSDTLPLCVYNVNFPLVTTPHTPVRPTQLASQPLGCLFEAIGKGRYTFKYKVGGPAADNEHSDIRTTITLGEISCTPLDFRVLGCTSKRSPQG